MINNPLPDATTAIKGKVLLAGTGVTTAGLVVQGNDERLEPKNRTRGCHITHNAAQSIAASTLTPVAFNTELYDYDGWHDTVTNNTRITVPVAGVYTIGAQFAYAPVTGGIRAVDVRTNGTNYVIGCTLPFATATTYETATCVSMTVLLAANDYIEGIAFQTSAGALNLNSSFDYSPKMTCVLIHAT